VRAHPRLACLLALLAAAAPTAEAATVRIIAFGDSVTEGYGDDSPQGGGYPARLQRWLRQRGYANALVFNEGLGGETTAQALSRVDDSLDLGAGYFILMEGTNDISQRVGVETIRFNLNELAARAEDRGMVAIHATTILRRPEAPVDGDNARTYALAASIRDLAAVRGRPVADVFELFESLPDLFENYYTDEPIEIDPVGHPNGAGYTEIGGLMLEAMLSLLETPRVEILAPEPPVETGLVVTFGAIPYGDFERVEWDFGDGGWAASSAPLDLTAEHVYLQPGTYTVTLEARTEGGASSTDQVQVQVEGAAASWPSRSTLIPVVARGDGTAPTDLVSDLRIQNPGAKWAIAELALASEIAYDDPPPARSVLLAPGSLTTVSDLLAELFGLDHARAALAATLRVEPGGSPASVAPSAILRLYDDEAGGSADDVEELTPSQWTSGQKSISGITMGVGASVDLAVASLDGDGGYVQLDLFDGFGSPVDSALFELSPLEIRFRSLGDLFRGLDSRPQPFTAVFRASGIHFVAAGLGVDAAGGQVVHYPSFP